MSIYTIRVNGLKAMSDQVYSYDIEEKGEIVGNLPLGQTIEGLEMRLKDLAIERAKKHGGTAYLELRLE